MGITPPVLVGVVDYVVAMYTDVTLHGCENYSSYMGTICSQ